MKTHLVIGVFAVLLLIGHVNYKTAFVFVALAATILPDIDSGFSTIGKHKVFKIFQFFTQHRGVFHSFSMCLLISFLIALYFPIFAFPFFLGYSVHLFADSFTVEGIRFFWPFKARSAGLLKVGGVTEHALFIGFCIVDLVMLFLFFV